MRGTLSIDNAAGATLGQFASSSTASLRLLGGYDDEGAVNLFSGSSDAAIYLDNAAGGSTIANNVIGFQPDGVGNGGNAGGVVAFNAKNNVLQYNAIGNSTANAVVLSGAASSGNVVQYNTIGLDINGAVAANAGAGVLINFAAKNNVVGAPQTATLSLIHI